MTYGAAFYLPDDVLYYDIDNPHFTPWVTKDLILKNGMCVIYLEGHINCERAVEEFISLGMTSTSEDVKMERNYLGIKGKPTVYRIVTLHPKQEIENTY